MFLLYAPVFLNGTLDDMAEQTADLVNETVAETTQTVQKTAQWIIDLMPTLRHLAFLIIECIFIYVIGRKLIKWLLKVITRSFERREMDIGIAKFVQSFISVALNVILVMVLAGTIGIDGSSIVAVVGSAGIAIGLALQGSLSNLAGGMLILLMTPFRVGDYIIVGGIGEGVVTAIEIFYTHICTGDNRVIVVPNGSLSNSSIINVTHEPIRRLDMSMSVDYNSDIRLVKEVLRKVAEGQELVLKDEEHLIDVYIDSFDDSAITFGIRMWTNAPDYFALKWKMQEDMKFAFDENGISIPFNRMDVSMVQDGGAAGALPEAQA